MLTLARLIAIMGMGILSAGLAQPEPVTDGPRRIVSMNLCADQMVLLLAAPGTVASVSFLTADSAESPVAHLAKDLVLNHGQAEEIIALDPDLIVAGRYTTGAAKILLRRLGYDIVDVDMPLNFAGVREAYLQLGARLGRREQAETLVANFDARFAALSHRVGQQSFGSVLILDANGFTVGRPSLVDQVLTHIGLTNLAADLGVGDYGQVTMEAVVLAQPDHMVRMMYRPDTPSLANQTLSHPVLRKSLGDRPMIPVPQSWVNCGGPYLANAAEQVLAAVMPDESGSRDMGGER